MNKHKLEAQSINLADINKKIDRINQQLNTLEKHQFEEWKLIKENKINHLAKHWLKEKDNASYQEKGSKMSVKMKVLKEQLRILIFICYQFEKAYSKDKISEIIQRVYFSQYGQQIFKQFEMVGFPTHEFQILQYRQSSLSSLFCCWKN